MTAIVTTNLLAPRACGPACSKSFAATPDDET